MKAHELLLSVVVSAVTLPLTGCDSENPLSDPQTSKADERLVGVWRQPGQHGDRFYRVDSVGGKFPGVMQIVDITYGEENGQKFVAHPSVIGDKTYLNVLGKQSLEELDKNGWKPTERYTLLKYRLDGNKLIIWFMDSEAKVKAIEGGKIKGAVIKGFPPVVPFFADTTENLARFVAQAGDSLWNANKTLQFERVKPDKER